MQSRLIFSYHSRQHAQICPISQTIGAASSGMMGVPSPNLSPPGEEKSAKAHLTGSCLKFVSRFGDCDHTDFPASMNSFPFWQPDFQTFHMLRCGLFLVLLKIRIKSSADIFCDQSRQDFFFCHFNFYRFFSVYMFGLPLMCTIFRDSQSERARQVPVGTLANWELRNRKKHKQQAEKHIKGEK